MNTAVRARRLTTITTLLAVAAALLLAGCGSGGTGDTGPENIPKGPRPAPIIYRPAGLAQARKVPLLIVLHGLGGSPLSMERATRFNALAAQHGFVVAYLGSDSTAHPWSPHGDDLAYVNSMIDQLTSQENIDAKRVYVTGFSAGAAFTYIVGCKLSHKVTAIAPVSAVINVKVTAPCSLAHPISVLTTIGSRDGAFHGFAPRVLSASGTASFWRAKNHCPRSRPSYTAQVGSAREQLWTGCTNGSSVGLYVIQGGTHIYPEDAEFNLPPSNPDGRFNASSAIWAFFSKQAAATASVAGTLTGVGVKRAQGTSAVVSSFRLGEPVTVVVTLSGGAQPIISRTFRLRQGNRRATLHVPRGTATGGYGLTIVLRDSYGRRSTLHRQLRLS
jgi:polyhydroxybutyrate depolymerase